MLIVSLLSIPLPSLAQSDPTQTNRIVADETLEDASVENLDSNGQTLIEGGTRREQNLFHSFREFSIDENQAVYFNPEAGIENILSRVTGNARSDISGTLGVNGTANLWLINPNGIVFREGAQLDIAGSFYATTAPAVSIGEGLFSAIAPEDSQLLSVSPEVSFQNFLNDLPDKSQTISIQSPLSTGGNLGFAAGQITTSGLNLNADNNLFLVTSENGSVNSQGTDIRLVATEGSIDVSQLITGNRNNRNTAAGNVFLDAGRNITTRGINSSTTSNIGNAGNGGNIWMVSRVGGNIVNTETLSTRSDASGASDTSGNAGNGGDITLQIEGDGSIINQAPLLSQSRATRGNAGDGGDITLTVDGRGGIVNEQTLRALSRAVNGASGNGGNITIETRNGSVHNQQALSSQSSAVAEETGNGGDITISAAGDITNVLSLNSFSFSQNGEAGNGGNISLATTTADANITNLDAVRSLSLSDGDNAGSGGNILMRATGRGRIANYGEINAQSLANGSGDNGGDAMSAGNITIQTELGDIINRPLSADAPVDNNSGSFNTRSVSRDGTTNNGGNISIVSEGGNIFLNAYLNAKSYSINSVALRGGNIVVSTDLGSIVGGRLENTLRTGIITSSVSSVSAARENAGLNGASTTNATENTQLGGSVVLQAGDTVSGFNIFTLSNVGRSGNIIIQGTGDFQVEDTQIITNEEFVDGNFDRTNFSGNRLFPRNLIEVFPGNIIGSSIDGIPILINTPESGQPGNVWITSVGDLTASDLLIFNDANSAKDAGDITLVSNTLTTPLAELTDSFYEPVLDLNSSATSGDTAIRLVNSRLATNTISDGSGGDINLQRANAVVLDNTDLGTNTAGEASAGDIAIAGSDYVLLLNNSLLLADARGLEDGGDIRIDSPRVIASPDGNNDIIVNASDGNAGNIFSPGAILYGFEEQQDFSTSELRGLRSNDISASSQTGQNGIITIDSLVNAPIREELEALSEDFSNPEQLISNSCIARNISASGAESGRFTIPGTGNFPVSPADITTSGYGLDDVEALPATGAIESASEISMPASENNNTRRTGPSQTEEKEWQLGDPVVEPEAVEQLSDGSVIFGQRCHAQ